MLDRNPESWGTETRIAILALLVEKSLETMDIKRYIEKKKNESANITARQKSLIGDEFNMRAKFIIKPSIEFGRNIHLKRSSDAMQQDLQDDDYNYEDITSTIAEDMIYGTICKRNEESYAYRDGEESTVDWSCCQTDFR